MRTIRTVAVFPTILTLGNLVCGFFAIVVAARVDALQFDARDPTNVMLSGWLIFLAMVFDALDGQVARISKTASEFGKQLDSLCDLVTFGVAPAFLLVKMVPEFAVSHRSAVWTIAASYAACVALRLARFNVETEEEDDHMTFRGLPSPAAAAALAGFAIMFHTLRKEDPSLMYASEIDGVLQMVLPFFAVALALLTVSRVPYPHLVNQLLRGHRSFGHVVALIFTLVAVMVIRGYAVPIVCTLFALSGPAVLVWEKVVRRREREDPLF